VREGLEAEFAPRIINKMDLTQGVQGGRWLFGSLAFLYKEVVRGSTPRLQDIALTV